MATALLVAGITLLLIVLKKLLDYRKAVKSIQDHPGFRTVFSAFGVLNQLVFRAPISGVSLGSFRNWKTKHADFEYFGVDIISQIAAVPNVTTHIFVADAAAAKVITAQRARFPKPVENYGALTFFGRNIVASEGDEWKRYRKVTAPAFSEPNNKLVWDETVKIMNDLFNNVWTGKDTIVVEHAVDITLPIALFVIGTAGFGRRISWEDDLVVPPGHKMTFKDSLHHVSTDIFLKALYPNWFLQYAPSKRLNTCHLAYEELDVFMMEMVEARRKAEKKEERYDLFSSLLDASDDQQDGGAKLTDRELLGNIFIFLLAGHETTAHTLCYTFALLAFHQDEQEILYQHIKSVLSDGREPRYEDMNKLTQSTAVFYETLRMYPPVNGVPKVSAEDTTLVTQNSAGETIIVPVPQGAHITLHIAGMHYNPRYWEDPTTFKPARFLADWPRDAFLPFSGGARACLGRRFFETEGIAILTMLVSKFKIEVKDEPEFAAETFEEKKARILRGRQGLTLTPVHMPLVFKRR